MTINMFDETAQSANQAKPAEDIFAATDKTPAASSAPMPPGSANMTPPLGPPTALSQGKLQPAIGAVGPITPEGQLSGTTGLSPHARRLILMIVIGVVASGGTFVGWRLWSGRNGGEANLAPAPANPIQSGKEALEKGGSAVGNAIENLQQDSMQKALNPFEQNADTPPAGTPLGTEQTATTTGNSTGPVSTDDKTDTDQDGLTDAEETSLGANPRLVDSDGDGLSDWEEVKVWGTKPLTADSDNDTYPDGEEVQNGYNPNGPGKLLDFEKAKQKVQ